MWDTPINTIDTAAVLFAHAIAIEGEAADRYREFATRMSDLGNDEVAGIFAALARLEAAHLEVLMQQTSGMTLPEVETAQHAWLDSGVPATAARELVFRMMTPRDAIRVALAAERRAQAFFLRMQRLLSVAALRILAQEMAAEESDHVALLERVLARLPDPTIDWSTVFDADTPGVRPAAGWHNDHLYFQRLLDLLEKEVDVFHSGSQPNYELMLDVIHYLQHFTDESHHPREDILFSRLAQRSPGLELPVARLRQEHCVIAHAGGQLRRSLEQAAAGSYLARADIEALAATYLVYYRNHIAHEEREILPAAERLLTSEDWLAAQAAAPANRASEVRYGELRRQIEREQALLKSG